MYKFKLYSLCACPGRCKKNITDCVKIDSCTCEKSTGSIPINLHALDNTVKSKVYINPKNWIVLPVIQMTHVFGYNTSPLLRLLETIYMRVIIINIID